LKRILCCLFLLLSCSSAEATSIAHFDPTLHNIHRFSQYSKVQSETNAFVSSWAPARDFLRENKLEGCSTKQFHLTGIFTVMFVGAIFFLVVLCLTLVLSKGMVFLLWILYFIWGYALSYEQYLFMKFVLSTMLVIGVILTKDFPRVRKAVAGICLMVLVVSLGARRLINPSGFSYIDDYSFPEYLVSSTSTNIVVVHEKMDLPYAKYGRYRKQILFRNGRMTSVRTNELATLLQAQAEEIRLFRQANPPQKAE